MPTNKGVRITKKKTGQGGKACPVKTQKTRPTRGQENQNYIFNLLACYPLGLLSASRRLYLCFQLQDRKDDADAQYGKQGIAASHP